MKIHSNFGMMLMKAAMQKFTTKIVNMMKAERLYESQGGPIILSQVLKSPTPFHSFSLLQWIAPKFNSR